MARGDGLQEHVGKTKGVNCPHCAEDKQGGGDGERKGCDEGEWDSRNHGGSFHVRGLLNGAFDEWEQEFQHNNRDKNED